MGSILAIRATLLLLASRGELHIVNKKKSTKAKIITLQMKIDPGGKGAMLRQNWYTFGEKTC